MDYTGCTQINVNEIKFTWHILNYSLNGKSTGEYLNSPEYNMPQNIAWYFCIYPKGFSKADSDFASLYIFCTKKNVEAEFSFAILDNKGDEANKYKDIQIFNTTGHGMGKYISRSDIKNYLISDNLTLVCKVRAGSNIVQIPVLPKLIRVPTDELSQDFQTLFENQKFTDVILVVKGITFNAHKAILSARSQVFSALFEHEMQENISSRVDIEDAESNVIEEMLRFIYTGKVKNINLIACELLRIADKYLLDGLKSMCEDALCEILSVENVLKILSLAHLYNAQTLKTKAVEFSTTHAKEIIQTAEFKSSENLNVQIFSELYRELALKPSTYKDNNHFFKL